MRGLFIVFEGGDGAGKTTQLNLLAERFDEMGVDYIRTREPGGTTLGRKIRSLLLHEEDEISAKAEALLYAADRAQHVNTIVSPALSRGQTVLQDRYIDSSLAYQGAGRVLQAGDVREISEWATDNLVPDLTILLDISPKMAADRMLERGGSPDRLERESLEFHSKVRQGFLDLANASPDRYLVCDAAEGPKEVFAKIKNRVEALLTQNA